MKTQLLFALLFLAFFRLLATLVEATYTFGLLSVEIPTETVSVLFLLTPLLLLFYPRLLTGRAAPWFALVTGALALLFAALVLAADPRGRMIFSGLGTGLFLLCLPALVRLAGSRPDQPTAGQLLGSALGLAGLLAILLSVLEPVGALASSPLVRFAAWVVLAATGLGLYFWLRAAAPAAAAAPARVAEPALPAAAQPSFTRAAVLWMGIFSALVLLFFGFTAPTVIARWTGGDYRGITALAALALAIFCGLWMAAPRFRALLSARVLLAWNGLFFLALGGTLLAQQIAFPTEASAYPLSEPAASPLAGIALIAMLALHPVIYVNFAHFVDRLAQEQPAPRALAGGLALAALYVLLMIFAQVFTTVYDYMPVVGPWFRDRFGLVVMFPALIMLLALLVKAGRSAPLPHPRAFPKRSRYATLPLLIPLGMAGLAALVPVLSAPRPIPAGSAPTLRVMTYNLQQGYDQDGNKNFAGQLAVIRQQAPDIIGLQESDTARIAGGNSDVVRYLAEGLDMYSYYGPSTVTGTFGIALLSRYPIENPRTFYMYSQGEQTAAIQAEIQVGEKTYNILVTHLGNKGPIIQQQQVLQRLNGLENVIAMGDFNFRPSSEQYQATTAVLDDAWEQARLQGRSEPDQDMTRRIDHFFISPGTRVAEVEYLAEGPSDHPAVVMVIEN